MNLTTIESINDAFYSDHMQRRFHVDKAKQIYQSLLGQLAATPKIIMSLNRSWISEALIEQDLPIVFPNTINPGMKFDMILAMDEVLTKEEHEQEQRKHIMQLVSMLNPGGALVASLRDFKNTNCHRRPVGDACMNHIGGVKVVSQEISDLLDNDKQAWFQKMYITVDDSQFTCLNLGRRRTLYFKQLAKYCFDAGAPDFGVLKDNFWRNHLRRSPEHIIWAKAR